MLEWHGVADMVKTLRLSVEQRLQSCGSARCALSACSKGHLIALDIIRGLVFLHSNKVVHADLKAKNVLLTQNAGIYHVL